MSTPCDFVEVDYPILACFDFLKALMIYYILSYRYILNTPNLVSSTGALSEALKLRPTILRVSAGSMTPSSHNLKEILRLSYLWN